MLFYFLLFGILLYLYYWGGRNSSKWMIFILLIVVLFRSELTGTDTKGYIKNIGLNFYDISLESIMPYFSGNMFGTRTYGEGAYREFVFSVIVTFINKITNNPFATIKIINIGILGIYYFSFKRVFEKENSYMSLAILIYVSCYLYFSQFNTLRQALATSLLFSGICFYVKNDRTKRDILLSGLLILLATFAHNTVFFVIPILLLSCFNIKEYVVWIVLFFALICDFFVIDVLFFTDNIGYKQLYSNIDSTFIKESRMSFNIYVHYFGFVLRLLFVITFCWLFHYAEKEERKVMNIWFAGLVLYILLIRGANISRFTEHLYCIQILIIPFIYYRIKNENIRIFNKISVLIFVYLIGWYVFYVRSNWYGIVPYVSIF